jgi:hypothetical protein
MERRAAPGRAMTGSRCPRVIKEQDAQAILQTRCGLLCEASAGRIERESPSYLEFPSSQTGVALVTGVLNAKPQLCNSRPPGFSIWVCCPRLEFKLPRFVGRKPFLFHFLHVGAAVLSVFATHILVFDLHSSLPGRVIAASLPRRTNQRKRDPCSPSPSNRKAA